MLRKYLIGAGLGALGLVSLVGWEARSYVSTGFASLRHAVKAEVPLEFEIERARQLVDELMPDMRRCMHVVAEQQVEVENLTASIGRKSTELDRQKQTILAMRGDLGTGQTKFTYAGKTYPARAVERDLSERFERFQAAEELLNADRRILAAREQTLTANRDRLAGMMQAKRDLQVRLEQLSARLQTLRAAETVSHLAVDDSALSHAKQVMEELGRRLEIKQRVLDAEGQLTGLIQVEESADDSVIPEDLGEKIDAYFTPSATSPENGESPKLAATSVQESQE